MMNDTIKSKIAFFGISKEDSAELAELDKDCFSVPWSQKAFFDDASNSLAYYVLARLGTELAGYCGVWRVLDEGQITNIAVKKDYRNQGIASAILEKILEYSKKNGIKNLSLEVRETNSAAIALYTKFGFVKVGYRKNYYHFPDEGAVLMNLEV